MWENVTIYGTPLSYGKKCGSVYVDSVENLKIRFSLRASEPDIEGDGQR